MSNVEQKCINCINFVNNAKVDDEDTIIGYCSFWEEDVKPNGYCVEFESKND